MNKFLEDSYYIDYNSDIIILKSNQLFKSSMSDLEKAKAAFYFVRDEINHSFDCNTKIITAKASDVLKYKTGICHAKANLLAALLRSQNIPTGFCFQHLTLLNDDSKGYCLHCLNAVYLENKWVLLDARGNTQDIHAEFSIEKPILAFELRKFFDEYFFNGVYSEPDNPTMFLLGNAKLLDDVFYNLPEKPERNSDIIFNI